MGGGRGGGVGVMDWWKGQVCVENTSAFSSGVPRDHR